MASRAYRPKNKPPATQLSKLELAPSLVHEVTSAREALRKWSSDRHTAVLFVANDLEKVTDFTAIAAELRASSWDWVCAQAPEAERSLRRNQLAERSLRARAAESLETEQRALADLGMLARGVGHELGNIWQPVLTGLELIERETRTEHARTIIDIILMGSEISKDLMSYGKASPGELWTSLDDGLAQVSRLLDYELKRSRVALEIHALPGVEVAIAATPLCQVLLNLLKNATHASNAGSKITVRAEYADRSQSSLALRVSDFGAGIAPEIRSAIERVLEHGGQGVTTKGAAGNGIGLGVCRGLVKRAGGELKLLRTSEKGTCFEITLPCRTKKNRSRT